MTLAAGAIRRATLAAARLQLRLKLEDQVIANQGRIDIFDVVSQLQIPLLFRPLDGLLGAYLVKPAPGMIITTKRPLSVQRFTAAHELGHHVLKHITSLDDENILRRGPLTNWPGQALQELEANAFASAFLLPRWLVSWHCKRQGWDSAALKQPDVIYQFSLRAGMSYQATCWTLHSYKLLKTADAKAISEVEPRTIKKRQLGDITPDSYHGDVWVLTERDAGMHIEGGPSDIFIVRLQEHSSSGYLWDSNALTRDGLVVVQDKRISSDEKDDSIGSLTTRSIVAQVKDNTSGRMQLIERRPWLASDSLGIFSFQYNLDGAESDGWSRAERRHQFAVA